MIDEQKINKAFDDFDAALKPYRAAEHALAANVDPCGAWQSVRPTVDSIIAGLKAVGGLIPVAKKAAEVLETLKTLLNTLCP